MRSKCNVDGALVATICNHVGQHVTRTLQPEFTRQASCNRRCRHARFPSRLRSTETVFRFRFSEAVTEGVAIVVVQMVTQHVGDCKIITVACAAANARHFIKNEMETKKAACLNACASCHVCASARVDAVARWPTALFICNKRRRTSRRRSTYSPQS